MSKLQRRESASFASESDDSTDESVVGSTSTQHERDAEMDTSFHTSQKDHVKAVQEMAKKETNNMRIWKVLVCITVLVTAFLVSAGTFFFLERDEDSSFEESFYTFASTIGDAAEVYTYNLFSTMQSCSNSISAAAITTNSDFPFVTVPAFEVLAESVRQQSQSEYLILTPKVEVGEVTRWNEYASANEGWYEESKQLAVSSSGGTSALSDFAPGSPLPFIYNTIVDENGKSVRGAPVNPPFYPIWQASPPPYSPYLIKANIGGVPEFSSLLKAADAAREGVFGLTIFSDIYGIADLASKEEDHKAFHAQLVSSSDTESGYKRPHTYFPQPIFREIYNDTSEIVGYISALVPWDRYFVNLLPEGVKEITCVLKNTCGQSFTYFIDGNKVSCIVGK
jgi:hypothetical protein